MNTRQVQVPDQWAPIGTLQKEDEEGVSGFAALWLVPEGPVKVVWVSKCVVLGQIMECTEFMRTVDRYRV